MNDQILITVRRKFKRDQKTLIPRPHNAHSDLKQRKLEQRVSKRNNRLSD